MQNPSVKHGILNQSALLQSCHQKMFSIFNSGEFVFRFKTLEKQQIKN